MSLYISGWKGISGMFKIYFKTAKGKFDVDKPRMFFFHKPALLEVGGQRTFEVVVRCQLYLPHDMQMSEEKRLATRDFFINKFVEWIVKNDFSLKMLLQIDEKYYRIEGHTLAEVNGIEQTSLEINEEGDTLD